MSMNLDARQRAMLLEMGVRVWQPQAPVQPHRQDVHPQLQPQVLDDAQQAEVVLMVDTPPAAVPSAPPAPRPRVAPPQTTPASVEITALAQGITVNPAIATLDWDGLQTEVSSCQACGLCKSRQHTVFGTGAAPARWLIVGEAPGEQEDSQGQPFVGPAGQLLDNMLKAVGLSRGGDVFITNVLKCRPPANRNPQPEEMAQCAPFLQRQIELVQPSVILALGRFAAQSLLQSSLPDVAATPLGKLRGQVHSYQSNSVNGITRVPVVVTYHPAYLLRAPADKAKAWADLCLALASAPHLSAAPNT